MGGRRQFHRDDPRSEQVPPSDPHGVAKADATTPDGVVPEPHAESPADFVNPPPRERPYLGIDSGPLLAELEQLLHGDEGSGLYFVIWNEKGEQVLKSKLAPEIDYPHLQLGPNGRSIDTVRERRGHQVYRELIHAGPHREVRNLLVGRSLEPDMIAHRHSGWLLAATGLVILAAGTLGGGWLSARAIRPITAMTAAAEAISAQNLSERINVQETDSELGKLATVLNGTFDRLQFAFERQQQFTADASHELRTPLSVISAHTELALSRPRSGEDYRTALETCQRASQRMRTLIDSLLVLARFDSGTPALKQDRLDLEPLIQDSVALVQTLAEARGIHLESQTQPCDLLGDWDRLSQVVTNLLTNAIRYNVDGGQVMITNRIEKGQAIVSVKDTGIGIATDQLPRIFDRFYQVDKARSRAEGSCGLGLSICKTIVEAHGGTISVTSEPDVGTTIEVRLPLPDRLVAQGHLASDEAQLVSAMPEQPV